jgi:hypothetical protein
MAQGSTSNKIKITDNTSQNVANVNNFGSLTVTLEERQLVEAILLEAQQQHIDSNELLDRIRLALQTAATATVTVKEAQVSTDNTVITPGGTQVFETGFIVKEIPDTITPIDGVALIPKADTKRATVNVLEDAKVPGNRAWIEKDGSLKVFLPNEERQFEDIANKLGDILDTLRMELRVRNIELATPESVAASLNSNSTAYENYRPVKTGSGVLFNVNGYNSKTSAQFIQVFDAMTLPADGAVPVLQFQVPAQVSFSINWGGKFGRYFTNGIILCNSSTGPTKTIGSADCWFDCQYI